MGRALKILQVLTLFSALFLFRVPCAGQKSFDSLNIKTPKHYFKTVIICDAYNKPTQKITDKTDFLSPKLGTYGIKQFILSLNTPIATVEKPGKDSGTIANTHYLLTFNYMALTPQFDSIKDHRLVKSGLGLRIINNPGKNKIFFLDVAPFVTKDATYESRAKSRLAWTAVWSFNPNPHFNWRIGLTKSFLWGNRIALPYVGFRFGRLDKVNFSIQVPRTMNLNIPVGPKFNFSIYTKPQGGVFNFSNHDSLYYMGNDATFHFARYEINTGFRADIRLGDWFSFYLAAGLSTKNVFVFYSDNANKKTKIGPYNTYFYFQNMPATYFLNTGLVFKFGRTKSYYNNKNIYDAIDLNNTIGTGDDNISNGNTQIPVAPRKKAELNLKSVQDLIDYNDY